MQTGYLLLVPALVLIAGCSEKIEAQENSPEASEIWTPPQQKYKASKASEERETDLKLQSPVTLD